MNIFFIPSWYPSQTAPLSGIFIQEQILALAEQYPQDKMIVSSWGFDDAEIPTRKPLLALKIIKLLRKKPSSMSLSGRVIHLFCPAIAWSARLPFGGASRIIAAHSNNMQTAISIFGHIDLIHAHVSYPAGHVARQLSQQFGIPYVLTEHMGPFPFRHLQKHGKPVRKICEAFRDATASIAVSPFLADCIAQGGCGKSIVIPNMVDESRFQPTVPVSNKPFVFLTLSSLTPGKGIDVLLKAIAAWKNRPAELEFQIGGDGPMRRHYHSLAIQLGISTSVRWLGCINREEAPNVFGRSHAFVLPSRLETFGVVYAEALACGKPVIATRCGGPESIVNKDNGLLVDVDNPEQLAQAMQQLFQHWHTYDSQRIRQDFLNRFSRPIVAAQIHAVYEKVLQSTSNIQCC